jgi:O-antigen ligase
MKGIKSIANSEKVSNFLLGGLFLYPVLPFNFVSILIILLVFAICIEKIISNNYNFNTSYKSLRYSSIFYAVLIFTLTYSENIEEGLSHVQKATPFFVFPIIFLCKKNLSNINIRNFLLTFIFANFFFIVLLYRYFLVNFFLECYSEMSLLPAYVKLQYLYKLPFYKLLWCSQGVEEANFFIHKVYNSMHFLLGIIAIYFVIRKFKPNKAIKVVLNVIVLIFSLMIINMVSLVNLFLLFVTFFIFLIFIINRKYRVKKLVVVIFALVLGLFIVKLLNLDFINKETKWLSNEIAKDSNEENNSSLSTEARIYINSCSFQIIKSNPVFGVGIGDIQDEQNNCYQFKSKNIGVYRNFYLDKLNAHNQYLTYFSAGGILLLIAFLLMIFNNIKEAILNENYFYIWFIAVVAINLIFESMFVRMYGVLFFCLFQELLLNKVFNTGGRYGD